MAIFSQRASLSGIPNFCDKYASVKCAGEQYGSQFSILNRSSYILAKWASQYNGNVDINTSDARPGTVLYFVKQTLSVDGNLSTFCFARVNWFQYDPVGRQVLHLKCGVETFLIVLVLHRLFEFKGSGASSCQCMISYRAKMFYSFFHLTSTITCNNGYVLLLRFILHACITDVFHC